MPVEYTVEEVDAALLALTAYAGNATSAVKALKKDGHRAPIAATLRHWAREQHWERYEEIRDKYADKLEKRLANDYLDVARDATDVSRIAIEHARKRLNAGDDDDPSKTAANLARVAQTNTDKRLALLGRPTTITENRDPFALLRGLAAKFPQVLTVDGAEAPQLEKGDGTSMDQQDADS